MRYFKRLVAMMMVMVMALACTATAFAAEADKAEGTVHELYYTTHITKRVRL
jgi:ABC-type proline/glycine betaine transport system substrate-binding protein